jgi:uncharacterized protein
MIYKVSMYKRLMEKELLSAAKNFPVVTLTGPRQSGKTTLVKKVFKKKPYVNLEQLNVRNLALNDPVTFLEQYPDGVILDEIQQAPLLLSYIQVRVDESSRKGSLF